MEICNTGVGTLNWSLSELEAGGAEPVPRLTGQKAPDANPPAVDRAPEKGRAGKLRLRPLLPACWAGEPMPSSCSAPICTRSRTWIRRACGTWSAAWSLPPLPGLSRAADYSQEYVIDINARQLWTVNTTTGATTLIGPCVPDPGDRFWEGMSWDEATDTMYAGTTGAGPATLYTLNLETGAATKVANIASASCIVDIAVDSSGQMYGHDVCLNSLLRIDKLTGATTVIGPTGFDAGYSPGDGL